jgi:endonuclease III
MQKKYNLIKEHDEFAAEIYLDRTHYFLTYNEIAEARGISASSAKGVKKRADYILKHHNQMWMRGLSRRARQALLRNGYTSLVRLIDDVRTKRRDLESLESVGHKTAIEIIDWLVGKP